METMTGKTSVAMDASSGLKRKGAKANLEGAADPTDKEEEQVEPTEEENPGKQPKAKAKAKAAPTEKEDPGKQPKAKAKAKAKATYPCMLGDQSFHAAWKQLRGKPQLRRGVWFKKGHRVPGACETR